MTDIIQEFSFSRHENFLEEADFGIQNTVMLLMGTKRGHLMKHLPLLRRFIEIAPERFAVMIMPTYGAFAALKKVRTRSPAYHFLHSDYSGHCGANTSNSTGKERLDLVNDS